MPERAALARLRTVVSAMRCRSPSPPFAHPLSCHVSSAALQLRDSIVSRVNSELESTMHAVESLQMQVAELTGQLKK